MALPFWLKKLCTRMGIAQFLPYTRRLMKRDSRYVKYFSDRMLAAPVELLQDSTAFPGHIADDILNLNLGCPHDHDFPNSDSQLADRSPAQSIWGTTQLREVIADRYLLGQQLRLNPYEQILVTHGASAAYASALDAFINPGDRVVMFDPGSPMFTAGAISRRARIRTVPVWVEDGMCRVFPEVLSRAMSGAMMLVLAHPMNPTGALFDQEHWEMIALLAKRHDVLVYVDETFAPYHYSSRIKQGVPELSDFQGRLIRVSSMSPYTGKGDLRVGWAAGPRQLIQAMALAGSLNAPYVSRVCQTRAAKQLITLHENSGDARICERYRRQRNYTHERLRNMGLDVLTPSAGLFHWVPVGNLGMTGREFSDQLLKAERVLVGSGDVYGASGLHHIRISFAEDDGRLREGLSRMARFISRLRDPSTPPNPIMENDTVMIRGKLPVEQSSRRPIEEIVANVIR